ncbi:hypothetical protein LTR37_014247 [Vermiconidia calcicola]|uniref:Uncharacterized protein n=1 Tax=Vermiconidia calcicola TaxID=1690605 RepID=A0ACC3MUU5_9PEZI|nr:hypothetical protein LTR37_014247 [Vermiconidia calcicola]
MADPEKVTVERSYFEALLRRQVTIRLPIDPGANSSFVGQILCHTSPQILGRPELVNNISISRVEYDSLLKNSREHQLLKNALFQGGITEETLELLMSGANSNGQRKDSGISSKATNGWNTDVTSAMASGPRSSLQPSLPLTHRDMPWRTGAPPATFNLAPGSAPYSNASMQPQQSHLRVPHLQRQVSYGMSSLPDDVAFDDDESVAEESHYANPDLSGATSNAERRTLYFSGFSDRTTYRDLLSVIKGGKLLSVNLRPERSATVAFLDGAAEFLAWAKRNDIYLNSKRIEVKWADRQFRLNTHISNKIANGATRNIVVHSAVEKGFTESQIRADMDHIHNLIIIDISFRNGSAYVSMNSIHNALFARTCMMSRTTYKGCKIEFVRDECDIPLPVRSFAPKNLAPEPAKKKAAITNRFDMLNMDGTEGTSDEENRTPSDDNSDYTNGDLAANVGVSLNFLDEDST